MNNQEFTKRYYIDRKNTNCVKWVHAKANDCLPMWIADMDFKNDERVIKALSDFINYGDYGYSQLPSDYYDTYINWHKQRNNVTYKKEWIRFSKGAVDAMYQIIYSFTNKGDAIMINTPLYPPFKATIKQTGRKVVESSLLKTGSYFTFNYKDIENKFKKSKVKMLMLCSPHNPIGRLYKQGELTELFELCSKYHVLICADEVHSDIVMPDQKFIPSLALKKYQNNVISINALSKTFSLPIFAHCHIVIPNSKLRNKFDKYQKDNHRASINYFNALPSYYGYKYGGEWLDSFNNVVFENYNYFKKELGKYMEMTPIEGSYLLFLNLGKYNKAKSASKYLAKKCNIMVNAGETFESKYNDWVRINLATSLSNIKKAVNLIKTNIIKTNGD